MLSRIGKNKKQFYQVKISFPILYKNGFFLFIYFLIGRLMPLRRPHSIKRSKGFWENKDNRRQFFLELAKELGFDPMVPENWRKVSDAQILAKKVKLSHCTYLLERLANFLMPSQAGRLLTQFKGLFNALQQTFPDLVFEGIPYS